MVSVSFVFASISCKFVIAVALGHAPGHCDQLTMAWRVYANVCWSLLP